MSPGEDQEGGGGAERERRGLHKTPGSDWPGHGYLLSAQQAGGQTEGEDCSPEKGTERLQL